MWSSDANAVMGIVLKIVNIVMLVIVGLAFGGQPLTGFVLVAVLAIIANPLLQLFLQEKELVDM
ncbi:MAG: hypothetical protein E7306_03925 [Butyrivibrio sp.]|nr:hypothetical protein [Butyrivibrio sp.]